MAGDDKTSDLFSAAGVSDDAVTRPLAVRMRPTRVEDVVGQGQALQLGSPLRRVAQPPAHSRTAPTSIILFGPPGVGKTTLAYIAARQSGRAFEELSAVTSGVKDLRQVLQRAHERLVSQGKETVLFIDEVHRFSKSQQDALLPSVENRDITFIGATTENPSFSIISPLLSRSVVVKLETLSADDIKAILLRALASEQGLNKEVTLQESALEDIIRLSAGDGRKALTILEAAAGAVSGDKTDTADKADASGMDRAAPGEKKPIITSEVISQVMDVAQLAYDRQGDEHYDVASAFIKSMRGSDVDASLHYLARMIRAGEDPRFIARRIMIAASEEVGMAAPQVLELTVAAAQAVAMVGMPEARIILSQAVIAVATAPKSNASYQAIAAALADVDAGNIGHVPLHLRNAPTKLMKDWGNHDGYIYAHDAPHDIARQEYMPEELEGREYYHPKANGYERELGPRLETIRNILHGQEEPSKESLKRDSSGGTPAEPDSHSDSESESGSGSE